MSLSPSQRDALEQVSAITASQTPAARERDQRLLRENGWNVQATVEQIFSMGPDDTSAPLAAGSGLGSGSSNDIGLNTTSSRSDAEDPLLSPHVTRRLSASGAGRSPRSPRSPGGGTGLGPSGAAGVGLGSWAIITWPVSLLVGLVGGVWYFIIRNFVPLSLLPRLPSFLLPPSAPSSYPRPAQDPTTSSLRFIRELETFTRCSSSTGTLPEFYIGPYREFIQTLRTEGKLGLIVLVCREHEDDEEFKRDVLADQELVRTLKEKEVVVWAGDVASREAYQASQTLLTTTYPSLTFLSLLPVPNSSTPRMTILSTLSGAPSTVTSTTSIIQTLTTSILPRVSPFLNRLKRERLSIEEARHLRSEQDRAFKEAERRDREKRDLQLQKEALERIQAERLERETREKALRVENRKIWRRYARKHLLPPSAGPVRIALRTPLSSERHIRSFVPGPSTLPLFIFTETLLIPADQTPDTDPDTPPEGFELDSGGGATAASGSASQDENWEFKLVTSFPRKEVTPTNDPDEAKAVWEIVKQSGGVLFAEKKEGSKWGVREGEEDDDSDEEVVDE